MFRSTPSDAAQVNLWSCALYPNLTRDFWDEKLSPSGRSIAEENVTDRNISTSNEVTTFLSTCLTARCENAESCGRIVCRSSKVTLGSNTILSVAGVDTCLDSICGVKSVSSPDIAGIGVIVSIFI
jgi:hypothetical protein